MTKLQKFMHMKKIDYMADQMIFVNLDDGVKKMRYLRMSRQRLNKG